MVISLFKLTRSLIIFYVMLYLGSILTEYIAIGVPKSIWGLLLLFILLCFKIIRVEWIDFGANLLLRYMVVLFISITVGLIQYSDILRENAFNLVIPNLVSSCLTLLLTAFLSDYFLNRNPKINTSSMPQQSKTGNDIKKQSRKNSNMKPKLTHRKK